MSTALAASSSSRCNLGDGVLRRQDFALFGHLQTSLHGSWRERSDRLVGGASPAAERGRGLRQQQGPLIRRGGERHRASEDTVELISRLAAHTNDQQIAAILNKQGRRTGTGLPFSQSRVKYTRQQHGIPPAPPPDPDTGLVTIAQAATQLGVSNATIYRWLRAGLVPGEQTTPHAPWRIRMTEELRARFVPQMPDGYLPLDEAAKRLGSSRQTVLHKVQRGELKAVQSSPDAENAYESR